MNNLFAHIPAEKQPEEIIETLLQTGRLVLKRIVSTGQSTPPKGEWYDQPEAEWCIVLSGSAALRFESEEQLIELHPGDYIHIPAHKRHQVAWTNQKEPTVWLALHYQVD